VLLFIPVLSLFPAWRQIQYVIINDSGEDIFLTAFPNERLRSQSFIEYNKDGIEAYINPQMGVEYIKDPIKPDVGPGFFEPVMIIQPLFGGIDADGVDVIQGFYEEFTIHDYDGNILITINDLQWKSICNSHNAGSNRCRKAEICGDRTGTVNICNIMTHLCIIPTHILKQYNDEHFPRPGQLPRSRLFFAKML
jgi:hypothetical protein